MTAGRQRLTLDGIMCPRGLVGRRGGGRFGVGVGIPLHIVWRVHMACCKGILGACGLVWFGLVW